MGAGGRPSPIVASLLLMAILPAEAERQAAAGKMASVIWSIRPATITSGSLEHRSRNNRRLRRKPTGRAAQLSGDGVERNHRVLANDDQQLIRVASILSPRTSNRKLTVGEGRARFRAAYKHFCSLVIWRTIRTPSSLVSLSMARTLFAGIGILSSHL